MIAVGIPFVLGKKLAGTATTTYVTSLVVKRFVGFKISLNDLNELFEQVFVIHGKELFDFLAVFFLLHNLHDVEVHGFFFVFLVVMVTIFAATAAFAFVGLAQYNVFFTVVEEIAYDFQQNIVSILIYAFDEIQDFFFGGHVAAHGMFVTVQRYRPSFFASFLTLLCASSGAP